MTSERMRPLRSPIWYSAKQVSGKPLHYGGYVQLAATETVFARSNTEINQLVTAAQAKNHSDLNPEQRLLRPVVKS